jgi:hypothetical protein
MHWSAQGFTNSFLLEQATSNAMYKNKATWGSDRDREIKPAQEEYESGKIRSEPIANRANDDGSSMASSYRRQGGLHVTADSPNNHTTSPSVEETKLHTPRALPTDFKPTPYTVIIGKGRTPNNSCGNQRLRVMATASLPKYLEATSRREKTEVISHLIATVREAAPIGSFVKHRDGRWWEVGDQTAREKIGYIIRDLLHDRYRSSSKSKSVIRKQRQNRAEKQIPQQGQLGSQHLEHNASYASFTPSIVLPSASQPKMSATLGSLQPDWDDMPSPLPVTIVQPSQRFQQQEKYLSIPVFRSTAVAQRREGDDDLIRGLMAAPLSSSFHDDEREEDVFLAPILDYSYSTRNPVDFSGFCTEE